MKNSIVFALPGNENLAMALTTKLGYITGAVEIRKFPDGETYIRVDSNVKNKIAILVDTLNNPDSKIVPLMFLAQTLKELGAHSICLVTPYLPYMRQDKQFKPGEAVNAILFAKFLSTFIDKLITIDPHLHRIKQLSDIYSIPVISTLHVVKEISTWICQHIKSPLIIGPDEESRQWVESIAKEANAPYTIIKKIRYGDKKVALTIGDLPYTDATPVLVDDIISTGTSMLETIKQLLAKGFRDPVCLAIHAIFSGQAYEDLIQNGAKTIVTCNTIIHPSNQIDITDIIVNCFKSQK